MQITINAVAVRACWRWWWSVHGRTFLLLLFVWKWKEKWEKKERKNLKFQFSQLDYVKLLTWCVKTSTFNAACFEKNERRKKRNENLWAHYESGLWDCRFFVYNFFFSLSLILSLFYLHSSLPFHHLFCSVSQRLFHVSFDENYSLDVARGFSQHFYNN